MKIIADSAIPFLQGVLEPWAEVRYLPGAEIAPEEVRDADALLIRTRTRCDERLLGGSRVRLIATATIGFDHIDTAWCAAHGIEVSTAAGCNARGVLQWAGAVLAHLARTQGWQPAGRTLGVVGVGHVGSLVKEYAETWGFRVLCCDPPREAREHCGFLPLEEVARQADILTFHTPLDDTTRRMAGDALFARMKPGAVILNSSRGEVVDGVMDVIAKDKAPTVVKLEPEKINALLGTDLPESLMREILLSLGFELSGDDILVPSWRGDVEHYSDIAEEVARFYGYNNIPCTLMRGETTRGGFSEQQLFDRALGETCRTLGYHEIITYSFISPSYYDKIRMPKDSPLRKSLKILNPLGEDTSIMRTTILPSMLEIITRNYNYRNKAVRLYELGKIYLPREDGLADEPKILSLGAYGDGMDFFTLKGGIEAILRTCRVKDVRFEACTDNASYHPGRCAKVYAGDVELGVFGQIHPLVAATYGVDAEIYAAELRFDALYSVRGGIPVYRPLPKFPAVTRDIAVVCAESVTVGALEDCIRRGAKGLLKKVELFDIYRGIGVAPGSKSVAFSLTLRADDRSLTGEEADEDVKSILALLEAELGAKLR